MYINSLLIYIRIN